jgi:hypothetical protein
MTHLALPRPAVALRPLLTRLHRHLTSLSEAHETQARFARLTKGDICDTGLPPEAILGTPAHDHALPFFMQRRAAD